MRDGDLLIDIASI